MKMCFT